ncbi:hypothetical protein M378DRAFT_159763, partial [Amanita muscaria Koide BX008]
MCISDPYSAPLTGRVQQTGLQGGRCLCRYRNVKPVLNCDCDMIGCPCLQIPSFFDCVEIHECTEFEDNLEKEANMNVGDKDLYI